MNAELEQPDVWNEPERAQALGKERSSLEAIVETIDQLTQGIEDVEGLLELAVEADDEETFNEAGAELDALQGKLEQLEFRRMFSGEYDSADCYIDLQAGSGGTEAQDWASMLMRMYLRWAESKGFKTEIIEESDGDVAGLKSATIKIIGRQLKAKLYELEMQKKNADKQAMEENKSDIGWGSQIRSYVLDDARIKDLRTGVETRNTQAVLDGDLDKFIEASLKAGL